MPSKRPAGRLNRSTAVVWGVAFIALAFVFGYFVTSIRDLLGNNPAVAGFLAAGATTSETLISGFLVTMFSLVGILAAIPRDKFVQALTTVPAAWALVAVAALVIGARPQIALAAWAGVVISFAQTLLGPTFHLDDWVLGISPFWHVPVISDGASPAGLVWVGGVTVVLLAASFAGFRRRDITR